MPDFICIGAHKAGSSWFQSVIERHPNIWGPPFKELHFFDELEVGEPVPHLELKRKLWFFKLLESELSKKSKEKINYSLINWASRFVGTNYKDRDFDFYRSLFPKKENVWCGETTPAYALLEKETFKKIKQNFPDIKIVYILRCPVDRAWSSYRFDRFTVKNLSASNVAPVDINNVDIVKDFYNYFKRKAVLERGNYLKTIKKIINVFDKENIQFIFYEDICRDPVSVVQEFCGFIGIKFDVNYFSSLHERKLVSKKMELPKEIRFFLQEYYLDMVEELNELFGKKLWFTGS